MPDAGIEALAAEKAIRDTLYRYCRALDRMDKPLAYSVFHPDAPALYHGSFEGTGHGFVDWVWRAHEAMERHSHQITNLLIELRGDVAVSESYVTVALWTRPDAGGARREIVSRGRYLDRWERRDRWAIARREFVEDLQTRRDLVHGEFADVSRRDERDPSFALLRDFGEQTR